MGMSRNRLNEIVTGKRPVTPESAVLIGAITGIRAQFWLHLQADYDLWHAMQTIRANSVGNYGNSVFHKPSAFA